MTELELEQMRPFLTTSGLTPKQVVRACNLYTAVMLQDMACPPRCSECEEKQLKFNFDNLPNSIL